MEMWNDIFSQVFLVGVLAAKVDRVITGITLNILALGVTGFIYRFILGKSFIPPHDSIAACPENFILEPDPSSWKNYLSAGC